MEEPTTEIARRLAEAGHYAIRRGTEKRATVDLIVVPGGIVVMARDRNDYAAKYVVTWHDLEHAVINIMRPAIDRVLEEIASDAAGMAEGEQDAANP